MLRWVVFGLLVGHQLETSSRDLGFQDWSSAGRTGLLTDWELLEYRYNFVLEDFSIYLQRI